MECLYQNGYFKNLLKILKEKIYKSHSLKPIARDNIKLDENELVGKLVKKMINPHYATDRVLQVGFNITLNSHHINHASSKTNIEPNIPQLGIEFRYINKIFKKRLLFKLE